mmetsp:Transcript_21132/g.47585  ORF Transcript_21132/g.47585 Transcript_21132/m.47585 type:complete len:661 (-) Transcript_21132:39-2021(-)
MSEVGYTRKDTPVDWDKVRRAYQLVEQAFDKDPLNVMVLNSSRKLVQFYPYLVRWSISDEDQLVCNDLVRLFRLCQLVLEARQVETLSLVRREEEEKEQMQAEVERMREEQKGMREELRGFEEAWSMVMGASDVVELAVGRMHESLSVVQLHVHQKNSMEKEMRRGCRKSGEEMVEMLQQLTNELHTLAQTLVVQAEEEEGKRVSRNTSEKRLEHAEKQVDELEQRLKDQEAMEAARMEGLEVEKRQLRDQIARLEEEVQTHRQLMRELEETRKQVEEDADQEIEELKDKYESKLGAERDQHLRLKGENGIMRKKFHAQLKEIEAAKDDNKKLVTRQKELYHQISMLEKEISGLKKEIRERDETIGDKEKRIYDLKKKNQELEKFKFVLDYKIKELKKQIEPRELEISDMKLQIKEMDNELERYHKTNSNLELTIADNKLKLEGQQQEILNQRKKMSELEDQIKRFCHDLHAVVQLITEPKQLKESVKALYHKHVVSAPKGAEVDQDIQKEYNRQREYLEKTVDSLKRKLSKDMDLHKTESMRIMNENVALVKEINELRREIKSLKQGPRPPGVPNGKETPQFSTGSGRGSRAVSSSVEAAKEIEMQRDEIRRLRQRLDELEQNPIMNRPTSREKLPPMEGFTEVPENLHDDLRSSVTPS